MCKYGTACFLTFDAAVDYYSPQGYTREDVHHKLTSKEIVLGPPELRPGEHAYLCPTEKRYFIEVRPCKAN